MCCIYPGVESFRPNCRMQVNICCMCWSLSSGEVGKDFSSMVSTELSGWLELSLTVPHPVCCRANMAASYRVFWPVTSILFVVSSCLSRTLQWGFIPHWVESCSLCRWYKEFSIHFFLSTVLFDRIYHVTVWLVPTLPTVNYLIL